MSAMQKLSQFWFTVYRKGSRIRALLQQSPIDNVESLKCGKSVCRDSSPSHTGDCRSTSSSDRTNSDSDVSVDDDDVEGERRGGYAAVQYGPTAASRLRFIVASEEKRRGLLDPGPAAKTRNQCRADSQHHTGQQTQTQWKNR